MSKNLFQEDNVRNLFGEDNVRNLFGEDNVRKIDQGGYCLKIFREENVQGLRQDNVQRGDNVQGESMSICIRGSNNNIRSGNSKTREGNS